MLDDVTGDDEVHAVVGNSLQRIQTCRHVGDGHFVLGLARISMIQ